MSHSLNEIVFTPTGTADEIFEAVVDFIAANTPLTKDATGLWLDANKTCGIATAHTSGATSATFIGQANATATTTTKTINMNSYATVRVHVSTNETAFYVKIGTGCTWVFAQNVNDVWTVFTGDTTSNNSPQVSIQNSESLITLSTFICTKENAAFCSMYKFIDLYNQVFYKELYKPITIQNGLNTDNGIVSFNGALYRFIDEGQSNWNALAFPVSEPT